jgi:hypothetical protein
MDFVILGHFHNERFIEFKEAGKEKALVILPSWRENWRYFYINRDGNSGFRAFKPEEKLIP